MINLTGSAHGLMKFRLVFLSEDFQISPSNLLFASPLVFTVILLQLEVHHPGLLGAYVRKNDMSANPQLDLDDVDCDEIIHLHEAHNKVDEKDLEARFYRYGVRPEYLQIQRILNSR